MQVINKDKFIKFIKETCIDIKYDYLKDIERQIKKGFIIEGMNDYDLMSIETISGKEEKISFLYENIEGQDVITF